MFFEALFSVAEHLDSVRRLLVLKKPQQWRWTQQQNLRHSEGEMLWGWESFCVNVCDNSTTCVSICQSMYVTSHFPNAVGGFVFKLWLALEMCGRTVQTVREQHCGGKHNPLPGLLPCCVWDSCMAPTFSFWFFAVLYTLTKIFSRCLCFQLQFDAKYSKYLGIVNICQ